MKKLTAIILIIFIPITGCSKGVSKRHDWQKKQSFKEKQSPYYNQFVASGGMAPDESNPGKRAVQEALNQGTYLNN